MCGRYLLYLDPAIPEIQAILDKMEGMEAAQGEICPSLKAPVIVSDGQGGWTVRTMQWGFPHWERKSPVINARQETVAQISFLLLPSGPGAVWLWPMAIMNGGAHPPAKKPGINTLFLPKKAGSCIWLVFIPSFPMAGRYSRW